MTTQKTTQRTAQRTDEKLWQKIKTKIHKGNVGGPAGTWNARKAQLAVAEYKAAGGEYIGKKTTNNSLVIWTKEDWGYIDGKKGNRYLPAGVRELLKPKLAAKENAAKKKATKKNTQYASYSPELVKIMKKKKVGKKVGN